MARIPIGNFGNQIAEPPPRQRSVGGLMAAAEGAKMLGDTAMRVGETGMRDEFMQQQALEREQRAQDEALAKARAANVILDRELAADQISQAIQADVENGHLHYGEAPRIFREKMAELGTPTIPGLDPAGVENLGRGIKRAEFKGDGKVLAFAQKMQVADFRMQTDGILDKLGKQASLPDANPNQIIAQAAAADELGARAYGQAWGKKKQDWIDKTWDDHLTQQAGMVKNSLDGIADMETRLQTGDLADKLDSNRRNVLMGKLDGYRTSIIQQLDAAGNRAAREEERRLNKARAEFDTFQSIADKGTILDPNYVDRAMELTAGTPYQDGVRMLAQQARETGGLASRPIPEQEQHLADLDATIAQQGRSPELQRRRDQMAKVLDASKADLKRSGIDAGLERGLITGKAPIDISTPEAFASSIAQRKQQADVVAQWAREPVSPLDDREADTLRQTLEVLPPKQRADAIATVASALGPQQSGALAAQLDKTNRPLSLAFLVSDTKTSTGRNASELLMKGAAAIKDGAIMKDDKKVTGWKATIAAELDGVFTDDRLATSAKDAAYYIAAGIAAEEGGSVSSGDIQRAVSMAIGGSIVEYNGKRLPTNGAMEADDFAKRVKSIPAADLEKQAPGGKVRMGGVEVGVDTLHSALPGQELAYAGPGRYAVIVKGRPVTNTAGRPIIVQVR